MSVTRREVLQTLFATGMLAGGSARETLAAPAKSYDLQPVSVADGISMIVGATDYFSMANGGAIVNCVLIETRVGVVVVDTGPSFRYGLALKKLVQHLPTGKVAAVLNTHHHPDHFLGNQAFAEVERFALPKSIELAKREGEAFSNNMYRLLGDWMRGTNVVPPNVALTNASFAVGGREFDLLPLSGHTAADLAILDKKTGVLIAGDLAFLDRAPTTPHADLQEWRQSIQKLEMVQSVAIIPGHGPIDRSARSLTQTRGYLDWLENVLIRSAAEGLSMMEVMAIDLPQRFGEMGAMPQEYHRSVAHLYPSIERLAMPLSNVKQ